MKKRLAILLTAVCAVSLLSGCGDKKKTDDKKESKEEKTDAKDIEYNASDYVTLGEYKGIKVNLESSYEVTDEDVKSSVEGMIAQYPVYEDTDKDTVEDGDYVNIDYEGLKDGEAFSGGTDTGHVLQIGSNSFIEGFEAGLIGAKVGEKRALDLTFPEKYQNAELAGQAVVFNVTVNKIVNKVDMSYDTITDDYVAGNFTTQGYKTVEDLKAGAKKQLESSNESTKNSDTQNAILEKLVETCKVDKLPEGLLDQRVKEYKEQMETSLKESYNMELADYLKSMNKTQEEFDTEIVEYMEKNLNTELVLSAIAAKEKIKADDEGFEEYVNGVISSYGYEDRDALMEAYGEDYVKNIYCNNKALELVTENAVITYGEKKNADKSQDQNKENSDSKDDGKSE